MGGLGGGRIAAGRGPDGRKGDVNQGASEALGSGCLDLFGQPAVQLVAESLEAQVKGMGGLGGERVGSSPTLFLVQALGTS